jgi:hypothetical protein
MLSDDVKQLTDLYSLIVEGKEKCNCTADCKCKDKKSKQTSNDKPDYLDVDKDGDTKESFKKALKDKEDLKEHSAFKRLYATVMNESQQKVCGTNINPKAQYKCIMKDGTEKTLKGESVIMMKDKCKSVEPAH